jgi:predicted ATP-binding protein involved in virulence
MWIKQLTIRNFRSLDDIEIKFSDDKVYKKFTIILGENGTGKSTILKAIALLVTGPPGIHFLVPDGRKWIRTHQKEASIEAIINASTDDPQSSDSNIQVKIRFYSNSREISWESNFRFPIDSGWLAVGYGPFRIPQSSSERKEYYSESEIDPRAERVANLFNPRSRLTSFDSWLKDLRLEEFEEKNTNSYFDIVLETIYKLIPSTFPIKFSHINKERIVIFDTPTGETDLDGLSDSFRSMMIWISDLLKNIRYAFHDPKDPLKCSGILLIDELDVHLHPRWQREIVPLIIKAFPRIQIIITTHSPLVLQGGSDNDCNIIKVRKNDRNRIVIETDLPEIEGWRADEILEGKFFGVKVYDYRTQEELNEHSRLIAKSNLSKEEKKRLKDITRSLREKRVVELEYESKDLRDTLKDIKEIYNIKNLNNNSKVIDNDQQ